MMKGFLRILLFLVVAPFIGLVALGVGIGLWTLVGTGSPRDFGGYEFLLHPGVLIATYTLGSLPALLTAIVSIIVAPRAQGWALWLWMGLSGGLISTVLAWLVFGFAPVGQGIEPIIFTVLISAAGAVAGIACAALFDGLAKLADR